VPAGAFAALPPTCLDAPTWYRAHFGNVPIVWDADDDNDGLTRFAEYAFGGQPFNADSQVARIAAEINSGQLQIHYHRRRACTGQLLYTLQSASDLKNWVTLAGTEISVGPASLSGFDDVVFRAQSAISTASPLFIRLAVQMQ
jgi:hypothetical protein